MLLTFSATIVVDIVSLSGTLALFTIPVRACVVCAVGFVCTHLNHYTRELAHKHTYGLVYCAAAFSDVGFSTVKLIAIES